MRDVQHISVQDNPIKRLPGFAFAGMRNITELHLGYNNTRMGHTINFGRDLHNLIEDLKDLQTI